MPYDAKALETAKPLPMEPSWRCPICMQPSSDIEGVRRCIRAAQEYKHPVKVGDVVLKDIGYGWHSGQDDAARLKWVADRKGALFHGTPGYRFYMVVTGIEYYTNREGRCVRAYGDRYDPFAYTLATRAVDNGFFTQDKLGRSWFGGVVNSNQISEDMVVRNSALLSLFEYDIEMLELHLNERCAKNYL